MKILSIDTSSNNCSVSITEVNENNFNVLIEKNNDEEKTHSQKLMPMIDQMFKETNLILDDINLLVCCVGPGSFTGIRIGVATVKAFADAKNIPTTSVTSLESLAYNVQNEGYIMPIIDAKNNNAYSQLFEKDIHKYNLKYESTAENIDNILDEYKTNLKDSVIKNIYCVGNGSNIYKECILEKLSNFNVMFSNNNIQSSISLAKCGYDKYKAGFFGNSNFLTPIYLRKSQAERNINGEK